MENMENIYVNKSYELISEHFNDTRVYYWKSIKEFVLSFPSNSLY